MDIKMVIGPVRSNQWHEWLVEVVGDDEGPFADFEAYHARVKALLVPCQPTNNVLDCWPRGYRHHAREIMQRLRNDADLGPPTDAEIVSYLIGTRSCGYIGQCLCVRLLPGIYGPSDPHVKEIAASLGPHSSQEVDALELRLRDQLVCPQRRFANGKSGDH